MAVYTQVSPDALAGFLQEYDIGTPDALIGIAEGVENSNYLLHTRRGEEQTRYILTLFERRMNPAELPWFLGLMRHLAQGGLACPLPVAGRNGALSQELNGRPATITTFLQGRGCTSVTAAHCREAGAALARLHRLGASYAPVRKNALAIEAWAPLVASVRDAGSSIWPGMPDEVLRHLEALGTRWPVGLPSGQIHADLFTDNVFFEGSALTGIIDFYFACTDMLAYDLAITLNAWCFPDECHLDVTLSSALLAGYESVRALEPAERAALPVLCQGAAIRFLATRLYDWVHTPADAIVTRKDPTPYFARLNWHCAAETETNPYGLA